MTASLIVGVLIAVLGGGGIGTAIITQRTTKTVQEATDKAVANAQEIDAQRQKLEGWGELVKNLREESDRKDKRIEFLERQIEFLERQLERRKKT